MRKGRYPKSRYSRRQLGRTAAGAGLAASMSGLMLPNRAWAHAAHAQDATPVVLEGIEELDLANLSPDIPDPTEPVTVSFVSWLDTSDGALPALRDQFHELHPTITVEFESITFEQATDQLTTRIAGNNPPNVAFLDQSVVVDFASRNALLQLDSYIEQSVAVVLDDYVPAFLDAALWEGGAYGLPVDGETTGLFYRTDMFEAAGLTEAPTTWEDFEAAAQAMTDEATNTYGFITFATEAAYYWYPWLWQNGGELLSEDGTQIAFNSDAGKEAAEFYVRLADYSPPDYLNSNSYDGRIAFAEGQVGMYVAGAWFAGVMQSEFPDIDGLWTAAPLPERVRCATTVAGDTLVIPAGSENQDAAWKWIEFLSAPQNLALWTQGTPENPVTLLPTLTSLLENPAIFEANPILEGFAQQMECGITNAAPNPNWGSAETLLNDALGSAIYGETDAATALDQAAEEGQFALDG